MRLALLLSSMTLAVAAAAAQAAPPRGTLTGLVTRGPITPVCVLGDPCDEPAPNVTLLFMRNGTVAGRTVTDKEGRYRVRLAAGLYGVRRPGVATIDRKLEPNRVRVASARTRRIDFSIDTGIR